jgi:hypothetical protein
MRPVLGITKVQHIWKSISNTVMQWWSDLRQYLAMESLYARQWARLWWQNRGNRGFEINKHGLNSIAIWTKAWPIDIIGSLCRSWIYLSQCFCVEVGENFNKYKKNIETVELCLIQSLCCGNVVNSADRCCMCCITIYSVVSISTAMDHSSSSLLWTPCTFT